VQIAKGFENIAPLVLEQVAFKETVTLSILMKSTCGDTLFIMMTDKNYNSLAQKIMKPKGIQSIV